MAAPSALTMCLLASIVRAGAMRLQSGREPDAVEVPEEDVDAWIYCPRHIVCRGFRMFAPMAVFAEDALHGIGARTRRTWDADNQSLRMVDGVRAAVAKGRQPLVLALGVFSTEQTLGQEYTDNVLDTVRRAGAYLVVYQTEQGFAEVKHHLKKAVELSAREMWDFSLPGARTARSLNTYPNIAIRYVPPGYSKNLEVGVDLFSPERREDRIGFMGQLTSRPAETRLAYEAELGEHLNQTKHVWLDYELRDWCNALPFQLNTHQRTDDDVGLEAFRLAPLLANKACVISQPADEEDMARWEGMVHFAEAGMTEETMREFQQDVHGCQERSYEKFKVAFDPVLLLKTSGFLEAWQPPRKS